MYPLPVNVGPSPPTTLYQLLKKPKLKAHWICHICQKRITLKDSKTCSNCKHSKCEKCDRVTQNQPGGGERGRKAKGKEVSE